MKENYNLNSIVALCLENEVSFELSYSENLSKRTSSTRAAMTINLSPAVSIEFGDAKHGTLVSRIHVTNNHKLSVRVNELAEQIKASTLKPRWFTSATVSKNALVTPSGLTNGVGTGTTAAVGIVNSETEITTDENGDVWGSFELLVANKIRSNTFDQSHEAEPLALQVSYKYKDLNEALAAVKYHVVNAKIYVEGEYGYPRNLVAATMGGTD